jgi:hypothetical protein
VPSSMIFASLVVLWLLILVPAVARRRQEVARPSVAALSGRVLDRPRRVPGQGPATGREREVDGMDDETGRVEDHVDHDQADDLFTHTVAERDDRRWERPGPRYRPGRGGFDPEAAALAARTRYAFRQRVVLTMLITAVVTGLVAAFAVPGIWWAHGAVDIALVGYLVYLRRQVRLEEAIRERRAARMAGTRRPSAADDPELDAWARRGRELTLREERERYPVAEHDLDAEPDDEHAYAEYDDGVDDSPDDEPELFCGTGEQPRNSRDDQDDEPEPVDPEPALPRLRPAPPPALPAGTSLVEVDEEDPELYDLDGPIRPGYRRAAGE